MPCPDYGVLEQNLTFSIQAKNGAGTPVDTDALPTYKIYEDSTDTEIVSGTMSKLDDANTTGFYSEQIALTTALGYDRFETYTIRVEAAISAVAIVKTFSVIVVGDTDTITGASGDFLTTTARAKNYMGITGSDDDTLIGLLVARATNAIHVFCSRIFPDASYREILDGDRSSQIVLNNYPILAVDLLSSGKQSGFTIRNSSSDAYHAFVTVTATTIQLVVKGGANADDTSLTLASYATLTALQTAITNLAKGWTMNNGTAKAMLWAAAELLPTGKGKACLDGFADLFIPDDPLTDFTVDPVSGIIKLFYRFTPGFQNVIIRYTAGYTTIPADLEQICIDLIKVYYDMRKIKSGLKGEKIGKYAYSNFSASDNAGSSGSDGMPADIGVRLQLWKAHRL